VNVIGASVSFLIFHRVQLAMLKNVPRLMKDKVKILSDHGEHQFINLVQFGGYKLL